TTDVAGSGARGVRAGVRVRAALGGRVVAGQDPVERAAGLRQHLAGTGHLLLVAGLDHLHRRRADLPQQLAQLDDVLAQAAAGRLPRRAELLAVLLDVPAAGVGQRE